VRADVEEELDVDPHGVRAVADDLRQRCLVVAAQGRVCRRIEVVDGHPTMGVGLVGFVLAWGSALTALGRELDLLGVELGKSAHAVVAVDRAGAR
jgi:hypothetical protein